jgi:hypothetical protein
LFNLAELVPFIIDPALPPGTDIRIPSVDLNPSVLSFGPAAPPALVGMDAGPPMNASPAPLFRLAGLVTLPLDPSQWPAGSNPPAVNERPVLDSSLDAQRLPLRYPLVNIDLAHEVFDAAEESISSPWSAANLAQPERQALANRPVQFEPLARVENDPAYSGAGQEVDFQVSRRTLSTPGVPVFWELPLVPAAAPAISPAPPHDSRGAQEVDFQVSRRTLSTPGAPLSWELPFAAAAPAAISPARLQEDPRTEPFRWAQAAPALPGVSSTNSLQIPFTGTATLAWALPACPVNGSVFLMLPAEGSISFAFARAPFRLALESSLRTELPFVLAMVPNFLAVRLEQDSPMKPFRWPKPKPAVPGVSATGSFQMPFCGNATASMTLALFPENGWFLVTIPGREPEPSAFTPTLPSPFPSPCLTELPFVFAESSPMFPARLKAEAPTEPFRWPQAPPELPAIPASKSLRILFSGIPAAGMEQLPDAGSAVPPAPRQEPISSALAEGTPLRPEPQQSPLRTELQFVPGRPISISTVRMLTGETRTEPYLRSQSRPRLPGISSANSLRVRFSGTAIVALNPAHAALLALEPDGPIPPLLASETPVPCCAPPQPVLLYAHASLEPGGIKPNPAKVDPRKRRQKPRVPANNVIGRSLLFPMEFNRPVSWTFLDYIASAPGHAVAHSSAPDFRIEEIHPAEPRIQTPCTLTEAERLAPKKLLASLMPAVHDNPREEGHAFGVNGFQRFRAAAHIRIPEPELRHSTPGDLPAPATGLPWRGVRIISEIRPGTMPIPLRPALQAPNPR